MIDWWLRLRDRHGRVQLSWSSLCHLPAFSILPSSRTISPLTTSRAWSKQLIARREKDSITRVEKQRSSSAPTTDHCDMPMGILMLIKLSLIRWELAIIQILIAHRQTHRSSARIKWERERKESSRYRIPSSDGMPMCNERVRLRWEECSRHGLLFEALKNKISFMRLIANENGTTVCSAEIWCWSHIWQKILSHVSQNNNSSFVCELHLGMTSRRKRTTRSSNWLTINEGGNEVTPPKDARTWISNRIGWWGRDRLTSR